jgi:hypothetical protein
MVCIRAKVGGIEALIIMVIKVTFFKARWQLWIFVSSSSFHNNKYSHTSFPIAVHKVALKKFTKPIDLKGT